MKTKKLLTAILSLMLVLCMIVSCSSGDNDYDDDDDYNENENDISDGDDTIKNTGVKIDSNIICSTEYSEGLALVVYATEPDKTYCIDKNGYVVFESEKSIKYFTSKKFVNGLILIDESICDKKGKFTSPEDVGVTKFYDNAINEGYIISAIITSDYATTKKELGIMDKNFKWVVNPSEALYQNLSDESGDFQLSSDDVSFNGFTYVDNLKCYLELATGKVYSELPQGVDLPSSVWEAYSESRQYRVNGNIVLDLRQHTNIERMYSFVDGKAPVVFYNNNTGEYYFTLIDEDGEFSYDPIKFAERNTYTSCRIYFEGNYILISVPISVDYRLNNEFILYDSNGKLIARCKMNYGTYVYNFNDGVITFWDDTRIVCNGFIFNKHLHYNYNLTPLY